MSIFHSSSFISRQALCMWYGDRDGCWQLQAFIMGSAIPKREHLSPTVLASVWTSFHWPDMELVPLSELLSVSLIGQAKPGGGIRNGIHFCKLMHWERESLFLWKKMGGILLQEERMNAVHYQQKHLLYSKRYECIVTLPSLGSGVIFFCKVLGPSQYRQN